MTQDIGHTAHQMTPGRASFSSAPVVLRKPWLRPGLLQWAVVVVVVFTVGAWLANHSAHALPSIVGDLPMALLLSITIGSFAWTLFPVVMHATAEWHRTKAWIFY